jgi:hypothetical protein
MKTIIFAAALALSGAAFAQTGNTVDDPAASSGPRGVTQQGTDPDGQACTPSGYNAGATSYPTCTDGMTGGTATGTGTDTTGAASTTGTGASAANLQPCSRTVTDRCRQTYERGVRR